MAQGPARWRRSANREPFAQRIAAIQGSLDIIDSNIAFVLGEVPSLPVREEIRTSIRATCEEFASTLDGVRKDLRDLAGALHTGRGDAATVPGPFGRDPGEIISRTRSSLRREVQSIHALVMTLRDDPALSLAHVLVAESAVNIYSAYTTIEDQLRAIDPDRAGGTGRSR